MTSRRRASDVASRWWHARASLVAALVLSPPVFVGSVRFVVSMVERVTGSEHEIVALQKRVDEIAVQLLQMRKREH